RCSRAISFVCSIPPNWRSAALRASCGSIPAAIFRSIKRSRCACISSAISASRRFLENNPSSRENQARSRGINDSGSGKDEIDSLGTAQPVVPFRCKLFASGRGQFVITVFTIVIRHAPLCRDPPLSFQAVKGGIKRSLLDTQNVLRHLLDPIGNGQAVARFVLQ